MTFITWTPKFNTGIEKIDAQHKQLVNIINELYDARHSQNSQEVVNEILSKLTDYAEYHFDYEEKLINQLNSSMLEDHKAKHQKFRTYIKEILGFQTKEKFFVEDMLMMFLESWLTKHILTEDMKVLSSKD